MGKVVKKPTYRIPEPLKGPSFAVATGKDPTITSPALMKEDLARSGLTPDDIDAQPLYTLREHQEAAYYIPYHDLNGKVILANDKTALVHRLRQTLTLEAEQEGKHGKYQGQSYAKLPVKYRGIPYILPKFWSFEGSDSLFICEGEKKAAKVMLSLGVPALGIPGKDNWRTKKGDTRLHPWIRKAIETIQPERVYIVPDGDIRRPLISKSYDELRYAVRAEFDGEVVIPELPHYDDKIDDLIVDWEVRGRDVVKEFNALPARTAFREPLERLIEEYDLMCTFAQSGRMTVTLCEANYSKLFREHPSYRGLWYDTDRNTCMLDDQVVTDPVASGLVEFMQSNLSMGRVPMKGGVHCLANVCKDNSKGKFLDNVMSTEWDGVERVETMFIDYCGAPDTPIVREVGSKWLAASLARLKVPGTPVDYMVITSGPQGIGKSSIPNILWGYDYTTTMLSGDLSKANSEVVRQAHGGLVCNFDELGGLMGVERNKLKGFITARQDEAREMYANFITKYKRKFVIYGSTNDVNDFLPPDSSGHRRYAVVPVTQVQFADLEADRDQLWAEALHNLERGIERVGNIELADRDSQQYVQENQYYEDLLDALSTQLHNKAAANNHPRMVFKNAEYYGFSITTLKRMVDMGNTPAYVLKDFKGALLSHGWLFIDQKRIDGVNYKKHYWVKSVEIL